MNPGSKRLCIPTIKDCAYPQSRQSLHCLHIQSIDVDEDGVQYSDLRDKSIAKQTGHKSGIQTNIFSPGASWAPKIK